MSFSSLNWNSYGSSKTSNSVLALASFKSASDINISNSFVFLIYTNLASKGSTAHMFLKVCSTISFSSSSRHGKVAYSGVIDTTQLTTVSRIA